MVTHTLLGAGLAGLNKMKMSKKAGSKKKKAGSKIKAVVKKAGSKKKRPNEFIQLLTKARENDEKQFVYKSNTYEQEMRGPLKVYVRVEK